MYSTCASQCYRPNVYPGQALAGERPGSINRSPGQLKLIIVNL